MEFGRQRVGVFGVGDEGARRQVFEQVCERWPFQVDVHRHPHQAQRGQREDGDDVVGVAGQHQRHAVAGAQAFAPQQVGQAQHALVQHGQRERRVIEEAIHLVGRLGGAARDELRQGFVGGRRDVDVSVCGHDA
ncbi:hypothetical protein D3C87_1799590 [compost metagenome]